ncbi:MAG: ThuA domain-containing protein [Verrucomicrobia bacterium]|nr:ThuA domain-containing protein [Verrucomicrobiota bacterium]
MKTLRNFLMAGLILFTLACPSLLAAEKLKALIVDGQNNHSWATTTPVLKWILEESGRFTVDVSTTPPAAPPVPRLKEATPEQYKGAMEKWKAQKAETEKANVALWPKWRPKFSDYDVIVSNYTGDRWPDEVRAAFELYVRNGGGLVIFHAADNAFPDWPEFNEMMGVGGWGGRNEKSGPMLRWRDGKVVRDMTPGAGGTHGPQHEFVVEIRDTEHPITKGLPARWLHAIDELYSKLRGPAKNLTVLATAFADPDKRGTGEHEPMLMTIAYGKGRVFHDALGHAPPSMVDIGFQATLARGTEWAATGKVTLPAPKPEEMPADKVVKREPPAKP